MKDFLDGRRLDWRKYVPTGWHGFCTYCRRRLDEASFAGEEVLALVEFPAVVACCVHHFERASKTRRLQLARGLSLALELELRRVLPQQARGTRPL